MQTAREAKRQRQREARKALTWGKALARMPATELVQKLADITGRTCGCSQGHLWTELPNGERGWYQARSDGCLRATIATALQVHPDEVPDAHVDERMAAGEDPNEIEADVTRMLEAWLADRGLVITPHQLPPVERQRWVGIVPQPGRFQNHLMLMSGDEVLHEPGPPFEVRGYRMKHFTIADIRLGITFDRKD